MASIAVAPPKRIKINRWLIAGIVLIGVAIGAGALIANSRSTGAQATAKVSTVAVSRGNLTQTVSGSGSVTANQTVDLAFPASGIVKEVKVQAGDTVKAGQTLASLDDRDLQSKVAAAQASLDSAQATLTEKQKGNSTSAEIASAQAVLDSAQKAYDKVTAGPTKSELASAQAAVASAQAAYAAALKDNEAGNSTLRSLKATLDQANVTLQQAQAAYDKIAWRSDVGASSEAGDLQDATIAYQKALADYNAQLTTSGTDATSTLASANATVKSAQENLAALMPTDADIASAKATLESAKASLAALTAPASDTDLAIAQASVDSAKQALAQAQLNLEQATLTAPFDGIVSEVDVVPGSTASSTAVTLLNQNPLHVELKLSENNVVEVATGQKVQLTSDALSDWKANGTVSYIAPSGTTTNGVVSYLVRVDFPNTDPRVRVGMTLNVDVITTQRDNVLLVPTSAILTEGNQSVVQVVGADGKAQTVKVQTGISDGTHTEITGGLTEGQKIAALPSSSGSASGSQQNRGGPGGGFFGLPF